MKTYRLEHWEGMASHEKLTETEIVEAGSEAEALRLHLAVNIDGTLPAGWVLRTCVTFCGELAMAINATVSDTYNDHWEAEEVAEEVQS